MAVATDEGLDSYMTYLSNNGTTNTQNYFDSDEFKAFKNLSMDLADKTEARELRLMDKAAIKRGQEYSRNYDRASGLYAVGNSVGLGGSSSMSNRFDGMS